MGHLAVQLKLKEHCKSTILQCKIKNKKETPYPHWPVQGADRDARMAGLPLRSELGAGMGQWPE